MRRSLIWSATLHVVVVVLMVVGLPRLWDRSHVADTPMIVEVVKIDEKTTAKEQPKRQEEIKKAEKKAPPPPPEPKPRTAERPPPPAPPAPPSIPERPRPEAEKVPAIEKTPPKAKVPEKPKKAPEVQAQTPPKTIEKARPKRRPLPPKDDFLQSVLRDVSPEERGEKQEKPDKTPPKPQPQERVKENRAPLDAVATVSEKDAIRQQIEKCWVIPAGARDADKLVVSVRIWVNPDGTVRDARILDQGRMSEPFFRSAAESAMRAVLNPRCSPLPIPPKKYDQFKEMVLDFNPKDAAGS